MMEMLDFNFIDCLCYLSDVTAVAQLGPDCNAAAADTFNFTGHRTLPLTAEATDVIFLE